MGTSSDIPRAWHCYLRYFSRACRSAHHPAAAIVSANVTGFPHSNSATAPGQHYASAVCKHQWIFRHTGSAARALCEGQVGFHQEAVDSTSDEGEVTQDSQHEYRWRGRFEALVEFKKEHGHCNVPGHYKGDPQLGTWVNHQRMAKAGGKLTPERVRRLEELGFVWSTSKDERWEVLFRKLEEFKKEHGHCNVPERYKKHPKLGVWVNRQRMAKAEDKLIPERERRLEGLGFVWSTSKDERWEEMFRKLEEFKEEHGHCSVPTVYKKHPKLGVWVVHQRVAKAEEKLTPERERRLKGLGLVWGICRDERWEEMFRQLEEFQKEHGHNNVPERYKKHPKLGMWVMTQRMAKAGGKLNPERELRLDELGFVWSTSKDDRWEEMFWELEEFKKEHGHCSVPTVYKKHPKLGMWVNSQRMAKAGGKLIPERERRLEGLGFVWSVLDEQWEDMFRQLEEFKKEHGHCRVPHQYKKNPQLGMWVMSQRMAKAEEKLIPERERRLDDLGFVWSVLDDEKWEEMFRQLEEFKKEHGHCSVPTVYKKNPKLGMWVMSQRAQAKQKGNLAPERERRLEGLGFVWRKSRDERWEEMLWQLEDFQMEHGHCNVPNHYKENPKLGNWVRHQREAKFKGKLPPERERRLKKLGFSGSR